MEMWITVLVMMVGVVLGGLITWIIGKTQLHHLLRRLRDMLCFKERVSINEEFRMTQLLAEKIKKANYVPDVIFAIFPGGAMVAEWLSRRFLGDVSTPIPVQLVCVITKRISGGIKSTVASVDGKLTSITSGLPKDPKVLIVNDIARSGHTLGAAREFLKKYYTDDNIKIATLFRPEKFPEFPEFPEFSEGKLDFYVALTDKNINFEWKQKGM